MFYRKCIVLCILIYRHSYKFLYILIYYWQNLLNPIKAYKKAINIIGQWVLYVSWATLCAVVSPLPYWLTAALSGVFMCSKIDSFIILGIILIRIGLDVFSGRDQVWMNYRAGVVRLAETHRLRMMRYKFYSSRFIALRHTECTT